MLSHNTMAISGYVDLSSILITVIATLLVYYVLGIVYSRFFHPLSSIPGPFLGSITDWWYFYSVRYGIRENLQLPLHEKYGPIVRVRPNEVSIGDSSAIATVFGTKPRWQKTDFYSSFDPHIEDRVELFTLRDDAKHTERRKIVAALFTPGAVLQYEPCVDRLIEVFMGRLGDAATSGKSIEMSQSLRYYTLDIMGEVFYGKEGGFGSLRNHTDHKNWMAMLDATMTALSSLSYVPKGMQTMYFVSQLLLPGVLTGIKAHGTVVEDAIAIVRQRREEMANEKRTPGAKAQDDTDMLSQLIAIVDQKGPQIDFTDLDVAVNIYDAIMAGSDTTAVMLAHEFYHIIRDRRVYGKLTQEVRDAFRNGTLSHPVRYSDSTKLEYWNACVKECLRFSPVGGIGLPRIVPKGGAVLADTFLPEGTQVTMNATILHFDKKCFGEDAGEFRPERWIENDEAKVKEMSRAEFNFGSGPRICVGRHLAQVETYKLLPALLEKFDLEIVSQPKMEQGWFRRMSNLQMEITRV